MVTEINELRKLLGAFKDGEINREDLKAQLMVYNQVEKRVRNALTYVSLMTKVGMKREAKRALSGNLLGNTDDITDELPLYDRTKDRGK
jgi:hypothetical protein